MKESIRKAQKSELSEISERSENSDRSKQHYYKIYNLTIVSSIQLMIYKPSSLLIEVKNSHLPQFYLNNLQIRSIASLCALLFNDIK